LAQSENICESAQQVASKRKRNGGPFGGLRLVKVENQSNFRILR
jgi:hypothetical protein